jgi:hypothetical protein
MPDLVNLLDHMKGKGVCVNGTIYQIDAEGIARDVSDNDAQKLLASRNWMEYDPEAAEKRAERRKAIRDDFKKQRGGIQLIGRDGRVIDPEAEIKEAEKAKAKAMDPENLPSMQSESASQPTLEKSETKAVSKIPSEINKTTDVELDEEWPDPHLGMKKPYLQEMARAYELEFEPKTTKQELIDMIMEAMYSTP